MKTLGSFDPTRGGGASLSRDTGHCWGMVIVLCLLTSCLPAQIADPARGGLGDGIDPVVGDDNYGDMQERDDWYDAGQDDGVAGDDEEDDGVGSVTYPNYWYGEDRWRKTVEPPAEPKPARLRHGSLDIVDGYKVLSLKGTPEQMGDAAGRLMKETIRYVLKAMIAGGYDQEEKANLLKGSQIMAQHQPAEYRRELRAMAEAAEVSYDDLILLQYFGDIARCIEGPGSSSFCTSFAVLPPLTREKTCIVGRNFDYFDHGVGDHASVLVYYEPEGKIPFVTVTWAGIINGWTLMNRRGIVVSNNTAYGADHQSLEGFSTCFMLRHVAEHATTVDEGVELIRKAKRSCGTIMLVASGNPPDAAIVEFDAEKVASRKHEEGFVGAANSFRKLYQYYDWGDYFYYGRIGTARSLAREHRGAVDISTVIADAEGVPIESMNLHCVTVDAGRLIIRVAMGRIPAYTVPFRTFRLTDKGLIHLPGPAKEK